MQHGQKQRSGTVIIAGLGILVVLTVIWSWQPLRGMRGRAMGWAGNQVELVDAQRSNDGVLVLSLSNGERLNAGRLGEPGTYDASDPTKRCRTVRTPMHDQVQHVVCDQDGDDIYQNVVAVDSRQTLCPAEFIGCDGVCFSPMRMDDCGVCDTNPDNDSTTCR